MSWKAENERSGNSTCRRCSKIAGTSALFPRSSSPVNPWRVHNRSLHAVCAAIAHCSALFSQPQTALKTMIASKGARHTYHRIVLRMFLFFCSTALSGQAHFGSGYLNRAQRPRSPRFSRAGVSGASGSAGVRFLRSFTIFGVFPVQVLAHMAHP